MKRTNLLNNESGSVVILVALAITVLVGLSAFAVDFGRAYYEKQKFQTVLDATSVAAAQDLPDRTKAEATMNQYIVLNGYLTTDINHTFKTSSEGMVDGKIIIDGTKAIDYTLAKAIGINSGTIHNIAAAERVSVYTEAFKYAVFAGGADVTFNGGKHVIGGSVYGKTGITFNGTNNTIGGDAVCTTGSINVDQVIGSTITNHALITMPDYLSAIKAQAIYTTSDQTAFDNYVSTHTINGPIYFNGPNALNISSEIVGTGIIYAENGIAGVLAQKATDSISFYSGKDITINGNSSGDVPVYGILYAPNGDITINGCGGTVYGHIIAQTVTKNGAKFDVNASESDLDGFYTLKTVKLVE